MKRLFSYEEDVSEVCRRRWETGGGGGQPCREPEQEAVFTTGKKKETLPMSVGQQENPSNHQTRIIPTEEPEGIGTPQKTIRINQPVP